MEYKDKTQKFIEQLIDKGEDADQAQGILSHLLELAVVMYQKGDIKTVQLPDKLELVCQLKKGSRRIALASK